MPDSCFQRRYEGPERRRVTGPAPAHREVSPHRSANTHVSSARAEQRDLRPIGVDATRGVPRYARCTSLAGMSEMRVVCEQSASSARRRGASPLPYSGYVTGSTDTLAF